MSIRAGVVVAVAFEQVDVAPYGKTCADGGDEGLQYVDCIVEEFHCVDLQLLKLGERKHHPGGMVKSKFKMIILIDLMLESLQV